MREHKFTDGKCDFCGGIYKAGDIAGMTCVWRADAASGAVRPLPSSIFATPWEIGDRLAEIRKEEDAALAGTPEIPEAADF